MSPDTTSPPTELPPTELPSVVPKPSPFMTRRHLWGLLVVWFPLNPFVLHYLSRQLLDRYPVMTIDGRAYLGLISTTILGPFTATLEGRNRTFCFEVAYQLLPVCLSAVVVVLLVQLCWRPRTLPGRAIRMALWMLGWFVWFCGAFLSVLSNSG